MNIIVSEKINNISDYKNVITKAIKNYYGEREKKE
jgi:hypothetical protein